MNFNRLWHQWPLKEIDAVKKWVKQGNSTPKNAKEMDIYKYNSVIPGGQEKTLWWKNLVSDDVTTVLRQRGSLNWCQMSTHLHAARIPNDQYSLYHSISVCLWGVPDEEKILKSLLKATIKQHGPVWNKRLNLNQLQARDLKPANGIVLPHHLFILANIICRPLIVLSDKNIDTFDGIYLPLMSKPIDCSKAPIFLAYCNNKFFPLLIEAPFDTTSFEMKYKMLFPLVNLDLSILPVKFLDAKEEVRAGDILQDYLIVKEIDLMVGEELLSILFLDSMLEPLPEDKNTMFSYVKTFTQLNSKEYAHSRKEPSPSANSSQKRQNDDREQTKIQYRPGSISPPHAPLQQPSPILRCGKGIETSGREGFSVNENGYHENQKEDKLHPNGFESGEVPYAQMMPSAPEAPSAPEVNEEPMSMTPEQCVLCKTFRSSIKTFPYCHECAERRNGISQVPKTNEKSSNTVTPPLPLPRSSNGLETIYGAPGSTLTSVNDHSGMLPSYLSKNTTSSAISPSQINPTPQTNGESIFRTDITTPSLLSPRNGNGPQTMNDVPSPMLTSVSDQSEILASYSAKNTSVSAISPSLKVTGIKPSNNYSLNHQQQNLKESGGDFPSKHEENVSEMSYDPLSRESSQMKDKLTKCASPVCEKLIQSPEQLCQRCIKILKVHQLSNCDKSCCNSPYPPREVSHSSENLKYHKSEPCDVTKSSSYISGPSVNQLTLQEKRKDSDFNPHKPNETHEVRSPTLQEKRKDSDFNPHKPNETHEARSPTLQEKRKDSDFNQHKPNETHEARSISPEPEFAYAFPQSLMVTSITSAYDTDQIIEVKYNDSFSHRFLEMENNLKKDALKCKTPLCTHFGSKDREGLCNVCFSLRNSIPTKHELDSMPVGISNDRYGQNMEQLESNVRKTVGKCKTSFCTNFGNKIKDDYCNVCYNAMQMNGGGQNGWYGEDQCDGVNYSINTDEIDGLAVSDLDSDVTSSQIDSSELFDLV